MERRFFSEVIKNSGVDLRKEYDRLYYMFYGRSPILSTAELIDRDFEDYPFRGTCLSLEDFNETKGIHFEQSPEDFDLNYLVNFCEYCYNLCFHFGEDEIINQINNVLTLIHFKAVQIECGLYRLVEENATVTSVSEIVPQKLSIVTLEYNHHSMKGNLDKKRKTLKDMADYLEPRRNELSSIDSDLSKNLFYIFNNFSIRHNNNDKGKSFNPMMSTISETELEQIYDDTYQLWLLAVLQLDNKERKQRINEYRIKQDQLKMG